MNKIDTDYVELKLESWNEEIMLLAHIVAEPKLAQRVSAQINPNMLWRTDGVATAFARLSEAVKSQEGHLVRGDVLSVIKPILTSDVSLNYEFINAVKRSQSDTRDGFYYVRRVVDRAGRRAIFLSLNTREILATTYNVADALGIFREEILKISCEFNTATGRGGLLKYDYFDNTEALATRLDPRHATHLSVGFGVLDEIIQFETSSYNIIGARPSIGKTAVSINFALKMALQGIKVMFITLEVSYDKILELMACCLDGLKKSLIHSSASQNTRTRLANAYEHLHQLPIELYSNCRDINQIVTLVEEASTRDNPVQAVFLDYAQIVRTRQKNLTDIQRLNIISEAVRSLKSDYEIALFLAAQLNRKAADNRVPRLEDLKGTGDFEQDADNVLLLDRPNKELFEKESASPGMERTVEDDQLDIYVRKNRFGRTGKASFHWDGSLGKIDEMDSDQVKKSERQRKARDDKRSYNYESKDYKQRSYSDGTMDTDSEMPF